MAISKKVKESLEEAENMITYNVEVLKAKECKNGSIMIDIKVNGITIYSCFYKCGEKNGKDWSLVQFPQEKGNDGKYYNKCWFPISKELMADIEKQIEAML